MGQITPRQKDMGLSQYGFTLLLARQTLGSGLGRVLTLGRQRSAMGYGNAQRLAEMAGVQWTLDKLIPHSPWADSAILAAGASSVESMDFSDYESCSVVHDLNRPVPPSLKGAFDTVFDGGTLEHVFDFPTAIQNSMDMLAEGGYFLAETPSNNWMGHGFYQFSPELFYRTFGKTSGCQLVAMMLFREGLFDQIFAVDDPEAVGKRVRHNVRGRTSLLVMAKKLSATALAGRDAQQSDYQTKWRSLSDDPVGTARKGRLSFVPHSLLRGLDNLRTDFERLRNRNEGLRRLPNITSLFQHCTHEERRSPTL
jgi:hypothetical protein